MSAGFVHRPACELCGREGPEILISLEFGHPAVWQFLERYYEGRIPAGAVAAALYEVARCRGCGFMWQRWVLDAEGMRQLYEDWISSEDSLRKKREGGLPLSLGYASEVAALSQLFDRAPCRVRVLDYGCGWGWWCRMAQAFGYEVCGLELSERRTAYARESGVPIVSPADLQAGRYDFVNAEQLFEHVAQPLEELRSLVQALAPKGVVRLSVPNAARQVGWFREPTWAARKDAFQPLEHVNAFTPSTLRRLAAKAGLQPIARPPHPVLGLAPRAWFRELLLRVMYRLSTTVYFRVRTG